MSCITRLWLRLVAALLLAGGGAMPALAKVPVTTCIAPARSPHFDCSGNQAKYGAGDFRVQLQFKPVRSSAENQLVLRTSSVWEDGQRFTFHYADGSTAELAYTSATAHDYMTIGAIFEFPVPIRSAPLTGITSDTTNSANWRGVMLGTELLTRNESFRLQSWLVALYAAFGGLSLALLAYNIALWVVMGHRFQLLYAMMVGTLMAYTFTSSSLAMYFFPSLENNDRLRINYLLLAMSAVAALRFLLDFFGPEVIGRRLRKAVYAVCGLTMLSALAFALLAPWQGHLLDRLYFYSCTVSLLMVGPIVYAAWRAKAQHLSLFLVAWSPPLLVSLARAAHAIGLLEYSFWLDNGNLIALSLESLLSTMLIVARLRELSSDRDRARAGEQVALRLANSDPLTGLLNRRAFLERAREKEQRHRLMLIDIDRFKSINDLVGHESGDEVLRRVANAIQSVRPADSLAVRLGGEEFALLVPEERTFLCSPELVLEAIRCQPMPLDLKVTASLGYAEGRVDTEDGWTRLYRLADAALYRAKADGRNRACRSTDFTQEAGRAIKPVAAVPG